VRSLPLALALWLAAGPATAGKLDLDLYNSKPAPVRTPVGPERGVWESWKPGDPRDLRGESRGVRAAVHASYIGLAIGGLAASVATGGVAPAVGFGLVTLINSWRLWKLRKPERIPPR
jgi:hypothetical protein